MSIELRRLARHVGGSMRLLSANRDEAFELLRLAVTEPRFDADRFEQRRAQAIAQLNQADQRPATVAQRTMMATVFAGHPYGDNASGVRETLRRPHAAGHQGSAPRRCSSRAGWSLPRWATSTPPSCRASSTAPSAGCRSGRRRRHARLDAADQAAHRQHRAAGAAKLGADRPARRRCATDPDWHAALVMAHILGGGQQSRLFDEVREKRGLAYSDLGRPAQPAEGGAAGGLDRQRQRAGRRRRCA